MWIDIDTVLFCTCGSNPVTTIQADAANVKFFWTKCPVFHEHFDITVHGSCWMVSHTRIQMYSIDICDTDWIDQYIHIKIYYIYTTQQYQTPVLHDIAFFPSARFVFDVFHFFADHFLGEKAEVQQHSSPSVVPKEIQAFGSMSRRSIMRPGSTYLNGPTLSMAKTHQNSRLRLLPLSRLSPLPPCTVLFLFSGTTRRVCRPSLLFGDNRHIDRHLCFVQNSWSTLFNTRPQINCYNTIVINMSTYISCYRFLSTANSLLQVTPTVGSQQFQEFGAPVAVGPPTFWRPMRPNNFGNKLFPIHQPKNKMIWVWLSQLFEFWTGP